MQNITAIVDKSYINGICLVQESLTVFIDISVWIGLICLKIQKMEGISYLGNESAVPVNQTTNRQLLIVLR